MIEAGVTGLRLLLGLGAIFFLGYALLTRLVPRPRDFTCWERAAFSFGVGALALTLWMLALTWWGALFSLGRIIGPPLALAAVLLLTPRGRRAVREDWQALRVRPRMALSGWDWLFLGLLALVFLFALPRAALYPMWAWDAVATWGCKARVFYTSRGLDLTCIDAHNYYPNLIPLLLSYLYFALGRVNDSLVQVVFPLWGALLLGLLYSLAARSGLSRRWALGLAAFLALNGTVFIVHLYIAYADLPLAFFTLGAAGLLYLWLADAAPRGSLTLTACCLAGLAWCKYEGPPLAATMILAAALTLAWLRPARLGPPPGTVVRPPGRAGRGLPSLAALHGPAKTGDRRRPHPELLSPPDGQGALLPARRAGGALLLRVPLAGPGPGPHLHRPEPVALPHALPGPLCGRQPRGHHPGLRRGPHQRRRVPRLRPGHPGPPPPPPHPHRRPPPGPGPENLEG